MNNRTREFGWAAGAILLSCLMFSLIQMFIYPLMDGWSYYPFGDSSLMPYRDYFFPVTPLTYWEAGWVKALGLSLVEARSVFLFVPALAAGALYALARLFASRPFSALAATFCVAALASVRLETLQGWNIQGFAYLILGTSLLVYGWSSRPIGGGRALLGLRPRALVLCAGAGLAYSAAALTKQTSVVTVVLVVVVALISPWVVRPSPLAAPRPRLLLATLVLPAAIGLATVVYLWSNGALGDFVAAMVSGGGKQPSLSKLLGAVGRSVRLYLLGGIGVAALIVPSIWLLRRSFVDKNRLGRSVSLFGACALLLLGLPVAVSTTRPGMATAAAVLWLASSGAIAAYVGSAPAARWRSLTWLLLTLGLVVPIAAGALTAEAPSEWIAIVGRLGRWMFAFLLVASALLAVVGLLWPRLSEWFWRAFPVPMPVRQGLCGPRQKLAILAGGSYIVASFVNSLSSTGIPSLDWYLPGAAVALGFGWTVLRSHRSTYILGPLVAGWLCMVVFATSVGVARQPYDWFGWTEPPVTSTPRVTADLNYVQGLLLAPEVEEFYKRLSADELAAARSSDEPDPTVFGFPILPAVQTLTPLRPYPALRCPVLWVDLCPDRVIQESLAEFKDRPADIVVWADVDDAILHAHEEMFSGGRSALRDWNAYREEMVGSGEWQQVDFIPVTKDSPNRWPIHVYVAAGPSDTQD